jgi:hypothetical protein
MQGLDQWLEAPYVNAAREEAAFEAWCEREDVDYDAPDAWERFEAAMEDEREDYAERRAEARMDRDR